MIAASPIRCALTAARYDSMKRSGRPNSAASRMLRKPRLKQISASVRFAVGALPHLRWRPVSRDVRAK